MHPSEASASAADAVLDKLFLTPEGRANPYALYGELRSLTDNVHGRLWEDRFAFCLKMLAYALFTRRLQKLYGKARPAKDPDDPEAERLDV